MRPGAVVCVCPPGTTAAGGSRETVPRNIALLSVGAAASVLSQILMFGLLPLAGAVYAPEAGLAPVPFVALLIGAVAATFPASILRDAFGRRAAFALGASQGVAGGLVLAWGLMVGAFWPMVLGAFWIGVANGFALQYRHAAATGLATRDAARSIAMVVGVGALIGVIAPTLALLFEARLQPAFGAGTALLAAFAHVVALAAAMVLPHSRDAGAPAKRIAATPSHWKPATAIAAAAWFGMTAIMVHAPLGLAACGIGLGGAVGAIAWHVVAMYAPAAAIGGLVNRYGALPTAGGGLLLVLGALGLAGLPATVGGITIALVASGIGWSVATSAAVVALHQGGPSRTAIAGHDGLILLAAIGGAFASRLL